MKGIEFNIPNNWGNILYKILSVVNVELFDWKISDDESYVENVNKNNDIFFKSDFYGGKDFLNLIKNYNYYIIFANIVGRNDEKSISISIIDVTYFKIYSNNEEMLAKVKESIINEQFADIIDIEH